MDNITLETRMSDALEIAMNYGAIDGAHHKMWVIDQMVRILAGKNYGGLISTYCAGEDGEDVYEWDKGVAP